MYISVFYTSHSNFKLSFRESHFFCLIEVLLLCSNGYMCVFSDIHPRWRHFPAQHAAPTLQLPRLAFSLPRHRQRQPGHISQRGSCVLGHVACRKTQSCPMGIASQVFFICVFIYILRRLVGLVVSVSAACSRLRVRASAWSNRRLS